jgi:sugar-specific transcriptional regulator TrmB
MNQEKECELLTKLGLTALQAKVYLALVHIGTTTAKAISAQAQIDRADVYRVIATLHEQSLVEKVISNPLTFRAAPIQDGINILLERKHKESAEIQKQASLLLKQYQNKETEIKPLEDRAKFSLVPPKETHERSFLDLLNNAQSLYAIVPREQFMRNPFKSAGHITKFLRKGGKHRL